MKEATIERAECKTCGWRTTGDGTKKNRCAVYMDTARVIIKKGGGCWSYALPKRVNQILGEITAYHKQFNGEYKGDRSENHL